MKKQLLPAACVVIAALGLTFGIKDYHDWQILLKSYASVSRGFITSSRPEAEAPAPGPSSEESQEDALIAPAVLNEQFEAQMEPPEAVIKEKSTASTASVKKKAAEDAAKKNAELTPEQRADYTEKLSKAKYYLSKNLEQYIAYWVSEPKKTADQVVQAVNTGIDKPFFTDIVPTDMSKGYLILVNKYNKLSSGYAPKTETLGSGYGYGKMEKTAAQWFRKMVDAAKADGLTLKSVSPYRSYGTQKTLYNNYVKKNGTAKADRFSARPGHSEHQTGLAVDINCASFGKHFENTEEYAWLQKHCFEYGFILRYLPNKEYITGYRYEPWHYRYVGVETATKVMKLGITYEEYYAYYIDK